MQGDDLIAAQPDRLRGRLVEPKRAVEAHSAHLILRKEASGLSVVHDIPHATLALPKNQMLPLAKSINQMKRKVV